MIPNFREEKRLWTSGARYLAGVDEVGRGALAGPVVACAVLARKPRLILDDPAFKNLKIRDSKKLRPRDREYIYKVARRHPAIEIKTAAVSAPTIDRINIRRATIRAMACAVSRLSRMPSMILIDGIETVPLRIRQKTFIAGDSRIKLISLASICAKVTRDRLMRRLAGRYPAWGFETHKGYGTKRHYRAIRAHGISVIHRRSFLGLA